MTWRVRLRGRRKGRSSFAWDTREDGQVVRTINRVSGLYDVSVVAQGAYPAAHAELVARAYQRAVQEGRAEAGHENVAAVTPGGESAAPSEGSESTVEQPSRASVLRARLRVAQSKSL
jgi:MoxR-like ATPase